MHRIVAVDADTSVDVLAGVDHPLAPLGRPELGDGHLGFRGDFREEEWAGCCFSPDGRWLFANVYEPGFTVAITGPWRNGLI